MVELDGRANEPGDTPIAENPAGDPSPWGTPPPPPEAPPPPPVLGHYDEPPERRGGCGGVLAAIIIALVVGSFSGLAAGFLGARIAGSGDLGTIVRQPSKIRVVPSVTDEPIVAAAAAAVPSVVNVDVRGNAQQSIDGETLPENHPDAEIVGNGSGVAFKKTSAGTYIITNSHVVQGADRLVVRDESGRSQRAKLIGTDVETDIAVLRVEDDIPTMVMGDSADLIVGQTVVAIGSPFGLEHSVTSGVVSALGRSLTDFSGAAENAYPLVDVIQTDAAINPGNSGGALVTRDGKLIGINTAIFSGSGTSGGIGFAIPANTAVRVADELIAGEGVSHPFLGVVGQTVDQDLVDKQKLAVDEGAFVVEVTKGSGAAKAGVREGDVITRVDSDQVRSMDDLILQVRRKKIGDEVVLTVSRKDKTLRLTVTISDKPKNLETGSTDDTTTR